MHAPKHFLANALKRPGRKALSTTSTREPWRICSRPYSEVSVAHAPPVHTAAGPVTIKATPSRETPSSPASAQEPSRIVQLAEQIASSVKQLQALLDEAGQPAPSFDEDAPASLPDGCEDAQDAILDASAELHDLLLEPLPLIFKHGAVNNLPVQRFITKHKIANLVPENGMISFEEIAAKTGTNPDLTKRLLRQGMNQRIFREPVRGFVAHTKVSKWITKSNNNAWVLTGAQEMHMANVHLVEASERFPNSEEPNQTGFSVSHNSDKSAFEILGANPEMVQRFVASMETYASRSSFSVQYALENYPWASLGKAHVVDIGGARGHIAVAIASRAPDLTFTVQDMPPVVQGADAELPPGEVRERIAFMGVDFFAPQTVSADLYHFRWVLHNWSDKYCKMILRAQIPALRSGAKLLIEESCMPEPGEWPYWRDAEIRAADLNMASVFNSKERTKAEWETLLLEADPRFKLESIVEPKGSALALISVLWAG